MTNYEKPMVIENGDLAESVYTASGGDGAECYTTNAYITQTPEEGRWNYCIHVDAVHSASHHSTEQVLHLYFNQAVSFVSCNDSEASCVSDGSPELVVAYKYHNNFEENIGLGDVYVESADGLAVTGSMLECNRDCEQHRGLY